MPFLIDGHNLIPHIKGIMLKDIDDEKELFLILSEYFKRIRKKAIVFFDRGTPAGNSIGPDAFVKTRFVKPPLDADRAIIQFISAKKKAAKNYTVVSSDLDIIAKASKSGARTISSREFAALIEERKTKKEEPKSPPDNDIEYWIKKFGEKS